MAIEQWLHLRNHRTQTLCIAHARGSIRSPQCRRSRRPRGRDAGRILHLSTTTHLFGAIRDVDQHVPCTRVVVGPTHTTCEGVVTTLLCCSRDAPLDAVRALPYLNEPIKSPYQCPYCAGPLCQGHAANGFRLAHFQLPFWSNGSTDHPRVADTGRH